MNARIVKKGNFWIGEVYGTWLTFGLYERVCWRPVTSKCFTRIGAMFELQKWKQEHCSKEFKL